MKLSVVIPAYNEEKRISKTLEEINFYLRNQDYSYEIVVVNDGSTDKTSEIVINIARETKNIRFINNKVNRGKGAAVKQGMLESKGEYRLFTDADNSTSIDHIEKVWPFFDKGYDIVIGSRDAKDALGAKQAIKQPFFRRFLGDFGNIIIQIIVVPNIWDTQCGFKCFTASSANKIFSRLRINRWGFDIEALFIGRILGYKKIGIIPVYWINDPNSKVNLKGYLQVFKEIFQIRWYHLKGFYKK